MNRYKNKIDLAFNSEGDFVFDSFTNDLADTRNTYYGSLKQEIITKISSNKGDWSLSPETGANITSFLGKRNTEENGERIRSLIGNELIKENFILPQDLSVEVVPVDLNRILILIKVFVREEGKVLNFAFTYSSQDNKIIPRNI